VHVSTKSLNVACNGATRQDALAAEEETSTMHRKLKQWLAEHRPQQKWLKITWKRVKFLWWTIPWIDKAYVFGNRFHHLELGLILIFVGWLLVIHDWFVYERPKVTDIVTFEAKDYEKREDGTLVFKDVEIKDAIRIRGVRRIRVPRPGSKVGKLKSRFFKPRPAFEKRLWKENAKPEEK